MFWNGRELLNPLIWASEISDPDRENTFSPSENSDRGTKSTDQALENQFFPLLDGWFPDSDTRFPSGEFCFLYGIQRGIS